MIRMPWFHRFANVALRTLFPLVLKLEREGFQNVPPRGPLLVVMNHVNFLDPPLAAAYLRPDILPIAKAELFRFPFTPVFYGYGAFPVRRGEGDLAAFKRSLQILREGHVMLISPEGTRTKTGMLQTAHDGAAVIALRSGAPILPVAFWGGKKFWDNLKHLRRTPVNVRVGALLVLTPPTGKPSRETLRAITEEIMYYIARMLPPEYRGVYANIENVTPRFVRLEREMVQAAEQAKEVMPLVR